MATEIKSGAVPGAMVNVRKGMTIKIAYGFPIEPNVGEVFEVLGRCNLIISHKEGSNVLITPSACTLVHAPFEVGDKAKSKAGGNAILVIKELKPETAVFKASAMVEWINSEEPVPLKSVPIDLLMHEDKAMRDAPEWKPSRPLHPLDPNLVVF